VKILFIYPNIQTGEAPHFVNGVAALSAYIKERGHQAELLFLDHFPAKGELQQRIIDISPDLIGFSTGSNQWQFVAKIAKTIKSFFSGPVVCGGPHPTLAPEEVIATPGIDMICIGEGEGALLDLITTLENGLSATAIPNLWVKGKRSIHQNLPRPLIEDIDSLPFADREIFDYPYLLKRYPLTATLLMSGRGCPYQCPYCINHALARIYRGKGKYTRLRSPRRVCDEIESLHRKYGLDDVLIYDDTFSYDRDWTVEFAQEYKLRFDFPFAVNIRPETMDDELMEILKDAGLRRIIVGVEAGNQRIREEVLKRNISDDALLHLFQRAHELGIRTWANTMMGVPGETPDNLRETIDFVRKLASDQAQVMVFYPYPGTDLGDLCRQEGYVSKREVVTTFAGESMLTLPSVSQKQIKQAAERFQWEALRGRVERQSKGEIDLLLLYLDSFGQAEHKPLQAIEIRGDDRICIPAHPPSNVRFRLGLAAEDILHFAIALDPQVWELRPEGTRFVIEIKAGKAERRIYEKVIDPKNQPNDRRWIEESIKLDAMGQAELRFRTETAGSNTEYGWAVWAQPYIQRAG
jgi:anaerobic magnesium-protoporphyrin IX monomethyl ester cyclase